MILLTTSIDITIIIYYIYTHIYIIYTQVDKMGEKGIELVGPFKTIETDIWSCYFQPVYEVNISNWKEISVT